MATTDPFTGVVIPVGTAIVRCPHGHVSLPDSWEAAGNRCCYPGCDYSGTPTQAVMVGAATAVNAVGGVSQPGTPTQAVIADTPAALTIRVLGQTQLNSQASNAPAQSGSIVVSGQAALSSQSPNTTTRSGWWPRFGLSAAHAVLSLIVFWLTNIILALILYGGPNPFIGSTVITYDVWFLITGIISVVMSGLLMSAVRQLWPEQ